MLFFLLPKLPGSKYKNIQLRNISDSNVFVSSSLSHYLSEIKKRIDTISEDWDNYKKYTNPYEFIHTNIPTKKRCIAKHKPLSRSYFKMIEIVSFFKLIEKSNPIRSFHLAEGPGGFIEALVNIRKNHADKYIGMTILTDPEDPDIPAWKKSAHFLKTNDNVFIELGKDGTGNILSIENFDYCIDKYAGSMDIITGDGGFNFSDDFNNQETNMGKLLFGQVVYALCMQSRGGSFILKVFDCFMKTTVDILALLSCFYKQVYMTKPQTSRFANSEKYIVCKEFLFDRNDAFLPILRGVFFEILEKNTLSGFELFPTLPSMFINKIEEYNAIFGQQQIENIHHTILLIENKHKNSKIDNMVRQNVQKCGQWCIKYNVDYNKILTSDTMTNSFMTNTNIFLSQTAAK